MGRIVVLFVVFFAAVLSACPIGWKELADGCQLQSTDSADDTQVQQPTVTEVFNSDENPDRPAHEEVVEDTYNETTTVGSTQEGTETGSLETDAGQEEVKKHSWDELEAEEKWEETDLGDGIAEETDLVGEETTTEIDGGEETTMETDVTTSVAGISVTCNNGKCTREKLFEEDMALSDSQLEFLMNVDEGETKKASAALSSRWPRGVILYELTPGVTRLRSTILRAMKHWEESTCLTFLDYKDPASEHAAPPSAEGRLRLPADTNCGGLLRTTGVIVSSNYPKSYSSNLNCAWLIEAPSGGSVRLMKGDFDLEHSPLCESDYVSVSGAFVSNRFCGRAETFPRSLVSVANQLLVRFKTDASKMLKGFRLPYYIV